MTNDPLKRTPLYNAHVKADARLTPFGGWDMPLSYSGQLAEHQAVRKNIGMFDVSHMGQVRFRGPRTLEFLQLLLPNNFAPLKDGYAKYTQLCRETGGVLDDLIVSRLSADEFFAVVNASTREKDVAWINEKAAELGFQDIEITDESEQWAMIAVQGPNALTLMDQLIPGKTWSETPAFTLHEFKGEGQLHYISRTGYTGESGIELLCPTELAETWWDRFLAAQVVPCGLAARDTLRLEAGYCLYGNDLDEETTPIQAGLGWSVSLKKEQVFIGRSVIENQKINGTDRKLIGLQTQTRRPLRHGDEVLLNGQVVGIVTSGGFSPMLNMGIALAYVKTEALDQEGLEIKSRSACQPAKVVKPPFVKTSLSK